MDKIDDSENETLLARGHSEKRKIKKQIIQNQKDKIQSFFKEFRGYCRNSTTNRKDELTLLFNELDQTLTSSDKEFLIKHWKPDTVPIILVSTIRQLEEIRSHLSSIDLSCVSFAQQQPQNLQQQQNLHQSQQTLLDSSTSVINSNIDLASYTNDIDFDNFTEMFPVSMCTRSSDVDAFVDERISFITRSTVAHSKTLETSQDVEAEDLISSSSDEITNGLSAKITVSEGLDKGHSSHSKLIKDYFSELSLTIKDKGDVDPCLIRIKTDHSLDIYKGVLSYYDNDNEPLLFQLALNFEGYRPILDVFHQDCQLVLNQRNSINISIFSFLLINNIDTLYQFLKYTKEIKIQDEVHKICTSDSGFRHLLEQKKRDATGLTLFLKKRIESVEKFCIKT